MRCFMQRLFMQRLLHICCVVLMPAHVCHIDALQLSAHEGDRVYLPCFTGPDEQISQWLIGNTPYPVEELPHNTKAIPEGLIIYSTSFDMGGEVACYTYKNKTNLEKISSLWFTVKSRIPLDDATGAAEMEGETQDQNLHTELRLRVTESDSIYIPCRQQLQPSTLPIWSINSASYPALDLPPDHIADSRGITLNNITTANLYIYKCYTTLLKTNELQLQYTVNVTVRGFERDTKNDGAYGNVHPHKLAAVSRKFAISDTNINISFRIDNMTLTPNCTPGDINTDLIISDGSDTIWRNTTDAYLPVFSINSTVFANENAYGRVNTTNSNGTVCAKLDYPFRFNTSGGKTHQLCTPEFTDACIPLPTDNLIGLVVLWSRTPNSDLDCVCSVYFPSANLTFQNCSCFQRKQTMDKVVLNVTTRELCWKNLARNRNGTKVLFARDRLKAVNEDLKESYTRQYISQTEITVQGPDPNPPNITEPINGTVCIESKNPNGNPVKHTSVEITDATGDVIRDDTTSDFTNDFCEDFRSFPQSCEPFTVTAVAFTQCSYSNETVYLASGINGTKTSYCDCLDSKVTLKNVRTTTDSHSIGISFDVSCLTDPRYDVKQISNLYFRAHKKDCIENCTVEKRFDIQCNRSSKTVHVGGLAAYTAYNVSVWWELPKAENVSTKCALINSINVSTYLTTTIQAIIGASCTVFLLGVILLVCCVPILRSCKKRGRFNFSRWRTGQGSRRQLQPDQVPKYGDNGIQSD